WLAKRSSSFKRQTAQASACAVFASITCLRGFAPPHLGVPADLTRTTGSLLYSREVLEADVWQELWIDYWICRNHRLRANLEFAANEASLWSRWRWSPPPWWAL